MRDQIMSKTEKQLIKFNAVIKPYYDSEKF